MNNHLGKLLVAIVGVIGVLVLFRHSVVSHFIMVSGDNYDSIIDTSILEHWYNVFSGKEYWKTVQYFAPQINTLGYNDGYFLYGFIYSFFRLFQLDPFLSRELLLCALSFFGYISFYALARYLKYDYFLSVMVALIFLFANNLQLNIFHSQLASLYFAPFVCLLGLKFLNALKNNLTLQAINYGIILTLFFSSWLLTAYYMAWISGFFALIFLIIWSIFNYKDIKYYIKWMPLIIISSMFILSLLPFLSVYIPTLKETGGHSFETVFVYIPKLSAFLDVGPHNIVFGSLRAQLKNIINIRAEDGSTIGFSYLFITLVIIAIGVNIKNKKNLSLSIATIVSVLFMIKIGNFTLWKTVYYSIPGAKGLRVVSRVAIFLNFPMTLLLLDLFARIKKRSNIVFICLGALTVISNINSSTMHTSRIRLMNIYNSFPPIPHSCKVFFVLPRHFGNIPATDVRNLYHNLDAMFLAEKYSVRTINGISTFNPPMWNFSAYPSNTYKQRVLSYLQLTSQDTNACSLDLASGEWILK